MGMILKNFEQFFKLRSKPFIVGVVCIPVGTAASQGYNIFLPGIAALEENIHKLIV